MSATKIRLSPKELELFTKDDWILTKNTILKKIEHFLGDVHVQQKKIIDEVQQQLPEEWVRSSAKISKGEYYKELPYRILDFPKVFTPKAILAIRTMFWWGHYFSVTLHLSGAYKNQFTPSIQKAYPLLARHHFFLCVNDDQWEHHFAEGNYKSIHQLSEKTFIDTMAQKDFCKIACRIPLQELDTTATFLLSQFKLIVEIVTD